jgi:hypothetical protein
MQTEDEIKQRITTKLSGHGKHLHATGRCPLCGEEIPVWGGAASELLAQQRVMMHVRESHRDQFIPAA